MSRKNASESTDPLAGRLGAEARRTARTARINRYAAKSSCACAWGAWGRLSDDGLGQHNPDRSEGPWGRTVRPFARRCRWRVFITSTQSEGETAPETARRSEANHGGVLMDRRHLGKAPSGSRPLSRMGESPPYGILGRAMETSASCE